MAVDSTASSSHPPTADAFVPEQSIRAAPLSPTDRIVRQVEAVDAWIVARRRQEQALQEPGLSRDQRMDVAREVEVLRRTHDTIKGCSARGLDADIDLMRPPRRTAVIAHRHAWFVDKIAQLLATKGVTVVVRTDNGAEALGAVVAEQPDILLVGDRLAMMTGRVLLIEARLYSPTTLLAAQASERDEAEALRAVAAKVFLRQHPPADVADAVIALHHSRTRGDSLV